MTWAKSCLRIQGQQNPIWVSETLPFGNDNMETQAELVPPTEWVNTPENSSMLGIEDAKCEAQATNPTEPEAQPAKLSDSLPQVPEHKQITRREQFHNKKTIKEDKEKAKGASKGKAKAGRGKGKGKGKGGSKKGKGRGKGSKQEKAGKLTRTLRNSKRRASKKAKARRAALALAKKRSQDSEADSPQSQKRTIITAAADENPAVELTPEHDTMDYAMPADTADEKKTSKGAAKQKGKTCKDKQQQKNKQDKHGKKKQNKAGNDKKCNNKKVRFQPVIDQACKLKAKKMLSCCYSETYPGCQSDHMDIDMPRHDNFQFSVYWTRRSVGVKILSSLLPVHQRKLKKPRKNSSAETGETKNESKWTQIAYFSGGSCTHVNIMLAETWAHSLHTKIHVKFTILHISTCDLIQCFSV
jgi:hypothetical protein